MTRRIQLMFEHPTCNVVVDVHIPLPEPIEEGHDAMAVRVRPACPLCKQPMRYVGWSFSTIDDDADDDDASNTERTEPTESPP